MGMANMFTRPANDEDRRTRRSGWIFLIGAFGMLAWLLWAGVQLHWAIVLVAFAFMISLLIARIVAETGLPFIRLYERPLTLMTDGPDLDRRGVGHLLRGSHRGAVLRGLAG